MPLGPHERSVRWYKRKPHWSRPTFTTEVVGEHDAFVEGERERQAKLDNMPVTDVNHQTYLPLVGGPLDGGAARVPTMMLRQGGAPVEMPLPVGPESSLIVPESVHKPLTRAVYRLDRTAPPTLRFVRLERI